MNFEYLIFSALAVLIALAAHEYCHAYAAYKLGDNTAKNLGRLTLNPIKHIDPIGAICMLFFHVGWAKPVPINARNFKDPKKGFAITAIAGPAINLVLAFISALVYKIMLVSLRDVMFTPDSFGLRFWENMLLFVFLFHSINLGLGMFNLLPFPPFDGSRILHVILPAKVYFGIMKYERKIYFGVLAWLLLGDYIANFFRMIPFIGNTPFLYSLVGIFSLSDMLGTAITAVSGFMFSFWELFPILR